MKRIIDQKIQESIDPFVKELCSMEVDSASSILISSLINWLESAEFTEFVVLDQQISFPGSRDFQYYVRNKHRRYFPANLYSGGLKHLYVDSSQKREEIKGWREIDQDEILSISEEISSWLSSLDIVDAFRALLELSLQWSERYNKTMGLGFAEFCGRKNVDSWTDEQLSMFLRWVLLDELVFIDRMDFHNPSKWPE
jgi:hypothetical protein